MAREEPQFGEFWNMLDEGIPPAEIARRAWEALDADDYRILCIDISHALALSVLMWPGSGGRESAKLGQRRADRAQSRNLAELCFALIEQDVLGGADEEIA